MRIRLFPLATQDACSLSTKLALTNCQSTAIFPSFTFSTLHPKHLSQMCPFKASFHICHTHSLLKLFSAHYPHFLSYYPQDKIQSLQLGHHDPPLLPSTGIPILPPSMLPHVTATTAQLFWSSLIITLAMHTFADAILPLVTR